MNEAEIPVVLDLLDIALLDLDRMDPAPLELAIREPAPDGPHLSSEQLRQVGENLLQMYPALELVAITRGGHGSLLVNRDEWDEHPNFRSKLPTELAPEMRLQRQSRTTCYAGPTCPH